MTDSPVGSDARRRETPQYTSPIDDLMDLLNDCRVEGDDVILVPRQHVPEVAELISAADAQVAALLLEREALKKELQTQIQCGGERDKALWEDRYALQVALDQARQALDQLRAACAALPKYVWRNGRAAMPSMAEIGSSLDKPGSLYETQPGEIKYAWVKWSDLVAILEGKPGT